VPQEQDYRFGRVAVEQGALTQEQLEECIEVLVALERARSTKRLWQVIESRGYMSRERIAEIRDRIEAEGPEPEEETAEEIEAVVPGPGEVVLAYLRPGRRVAVLPLPKRLVSLGRDPGCDIVLEEPDVAPEHAWIRWRGNRFVVDDTGRGTGVILNDVRVRSHEVRPNDLLQLGGAYILVLADYGDRPSPRPTDPGAREERPEARLIVETGPGRGTPFFLWGDPVVIGRHPLACVRLNDESMSEFSVHVVRVAEGFRVLDLKSAEGIRVNGLSVTHHLLRDGDTLSVGACTLRFEALGEGPEEEEWDVPLDVEVEPASDAMIEAGLKAPENVPRQRRLPKPYAPGELRLTCVDGAAEGKSFVLAKAATIIGRGADADVVLRDASVSRHHAQVVLEPRYPRIRDLRSRNGVYVNGTRVSSAVLRTGDAVRIGKCLLIVEEVLPSSADHRSR